MSGHRVEASSPSGIKIVLMRAVRVPAHFVRLSTCHCTHTPAVNLLPFVRLQAGHILCYSPSTVSVKPTPARPREAAGRAFAFELQHPAFLTYLNSRNPTAFGTTSWSWSGRLSGPLGAALGRSTSVHWRSFKALVKLLSEQLR